MQKRNPELVANLKSDFATRKDYVAKIGGTMTGPLVIQKDYTFNQINSVPLRIVGSGQDADLGGWPLLEIYNPDPNNVGQYAGEAKIFIRAGNGQNRRRYIHFRRYDNAADDWIWGANASNVRMEYDAVNNVHRSWLIAGGDSHYAAAGTGRLRLNYSLSDATGSGGTFIYSGTAAPADNIPIVKINLLTAGNPDTQAQLALNSGKNSAQNAYLVFQDRESSKFQLGKSAANAFSVYDFTNSRYLFFGSTAGLVGINNTAPSSAMVHIHAPTSTIGLRVRGAASQAAIRVDNASAAIQFAVQESGAILTNQTAGNTNTPSGATARQMAIYSEAGVLLGYIPVYGSAW